MPTQTILSEATDEQLCLAVQENLFDLFRAMATYLGGESDRHAKIRMPSLIHTLARIGIGKDI